MDKLEDTYHKYMVGDTDQRSGLKLDYSFDRVPEPNKLDILKISDSKHADESDDD